MFSGVPLEKGSLQTVLLNEDRELCTLLSASRGINLRLFPLETLTSTGSVSCGGRYSKMCEEVCIMLVVCIYILRSDVFAKELCQHNAFDTEI